MPPDQLQLQKKTIINLSKPYHSGKLLIDLKPNKNIIDIKPSQKQSAQIPKVTHLDYDLNYESKTLTRIKEPAISEVEFLVEDLKKPTLNFSQFGDAKNIFDPKAKPEYRDANDVKIESKINKNEAQTEKNENTQKKTQVKSFVKSLMDIKKGNETKSQISLSHKKPKITIDPLNSTSKVLAITDHNRTLSTKVNNQRFDLKVKLMQQKHKADLDKFNVIDQFSSKKQSFEDFSSNNFTFKAPPKFDSSNMPSSVFEDSFFKKADPESTRINLDKLNGEIHDSKLRRKIRTTNKIKRYSVSTTFATAVLIICTLFLTGNAQWMGQINSKNVQAGKNVNQQTQKYDQWILKNNSNKYSPPGNDLDQDGLNNYEEYLIDSNPINKYSCNNNFTDNENVINLIDPVFCNPIDFNNKAEVERFAPILNIPESFIKNLSNIGVENLKTKESIITISSNSAAIVSDIKSRSITDLVNPTTPILVEAKSQTQKESSLLNLKVEQYIDQYRSFEAYDKFVPNPISSDYYISMSEKYGVPLKYALAIARSESRFGTDQYNQNGTLNRIGANKNIYSIGLDDVGGNVNYGTWESGADAFGKWYESFNVQGYSDCAKWRIYNPNGDYCQKIENLANEIQEYIGS